MKTFNILPIISEKSMHQVGDSKFTFKVDKKLNKRDIRKLIQDKFKVHVLTVSTAIVKGRTKKVGARRAQVAISDWKKAIVGLKKDEKIDLFDAGA